MQNPNLTPRIVGLNGVNFNGRKYFHSALFNMPDTEVLVEYNPADSQQIGIYNKFDKQLICTAKAVTQHNGATL